MKILNPKTATPLLEDGVALLPCLSDTEFAALQKIYTEQVLPTAVNNEFYWSISDDNKERTRLINQQIKDVLTEYLKTHFQDIRPIVTSFIVKAPEALTLVAHQDWTFVDDEPEHNSYTCWIPLVDVNEQNGHLGFYKGSHLMYPGFRASPSPQYPRLFPETDDTFNKIEYVNMKAGDAIVFNHRIIHASKPNLSNSFRPAVIIAFTSTDSTLIHTYLKPDKNRNTLQKYLVDETFFDMYSNKELSELYEAGKELPGYPLQEEITVTI